MLTGWISRDYKDDYTNEALDQLWDGDSQQIFASIIAFWFGTQSFKK